jgi:hypothetical protein
MKCTYVVLWGTYKWNLFVALMWQLQVVQMYVWHSKHTGRHLCRTPRLIGWVANMDYSTVKLEDVYQMDEIQKWMCAV